MGAVQQDNEKSLSPKKNAKQQSKNRSVKESSPKTAHDWRKYETKEIAESDGISPVEVEFYDDGTVTFFWLLSIYFLKFINH